MTDSHPPDGIPSTRNSLLNATRDQAHAFPDWNQLYTHSEAHSLPWYHPVLDPDLAAALAEHHLLGGRALDLGTGPGTQAIELAKLGFEVTGSDLSAAAIEQAAIRAREAGVSIDWRQDDILATGLQGPFGLIFDRGCFHVLAPEQRPAYVATVRSLLAPEGSGWFFLKCFSDLQPGDQGPYRYTPAQIAETFGGAFELLATTRTEYQGTLSPQPQALFCVLRPRRV